MAQERYHVDTSFHDWPRRPTLSAAASLYFCACVGQVALWLVRRALGLAAPQFNALALSWLIAILFQMGFLLLPVTRYCAGRPGMLYGMRLKACSPMAMALSAMAAVAAVFLAESLGTLWLLLLQALGARITPGVDWSADGPFALAMRLTVSALLPALCEELLFRGAILSAWERRGRRGALFASALLFTSLHASVEGLPVHFLMGWTLGVVVMGADSLYAGMLFHCLYNALVLLLGTGGDPSEQSLYVLLGGAAGIWRTAGRAALYAIVLAGIVYTLWLVCAPRRQQSPPMRQNMDLGTIVVLSGGVVTAVCVYLIDFLTLWGVL